MAASLSGKVCVVTGASRGIGKGIALQLSEAGATVYITGRKEGTLVQAAQEVQSRGGKCIPVVCDSTKDDDIQLLFERVRREQKGRLDILVNNAFAAVQTIIANQKKKFWEFPVTFWDDINNAGLRGHYICSVYAARMMVEAQRGLIVIISSIGGLMHAFNVPYGVGKEACDRLAADCAMELRKHGVAYVSLWPGAVLTETVEEYLSNMESSGQQSEYQRIFSNAETPELSGKCIVSLAADRNLMKLSGKVLLTCDLARRYGLRDVDGRSVSQFTSLRNLCVFFPSLAWLSRFIPEFIRIPKWILTLSASKF
ncbi:dehydrogenase/reductase SDR family member 1-like [Rhinatrema bivittatum]|uniref:dehydrogenase/reductase SDR family member 1-like n=1 Tax=Rhinatrema bivittatum TaxID=194408 RepID=UPI00112602D5|nr:dehydrogenase/reductase SDR family member 1-like [Rhinatrema bivittatum]XP_029440526.1 dehydrogenase/reductase SDR family member 1-like [Rhinatrema bivittatum]XP_029440527.1 dehydrogenase/reductase SDR family member 1-like [Rhinatrema bivittatum]